MVCTTEIGKTGCLGIAVFISNRALSPNHSYDYSIDKEAEKYAERGAFPVYFKTNLTLPLVVYIVFFFRKA